MTGCREYQGTRQHDGYARVYLPGPNGRRRLVQLHRWVWESVNGPIPPGMIIMHLCDNPPCFLYAHLRLGTKSDNIRDAVAKGRTAALGRPRKELCPRGHQKVYPGERGQGVCRICATENARRLREKKRGGAPKRRGGRPKQTHCNRGHLFVSRPNGKNRCFICENEQQRERARKKKETS